MTSIYYTAFARAKAAYEKQIVRPGYPSPHPGIFSLFTTSEHRLTADEKALGTLLLFAREDRGTKANIEAYLQHCLKSSSNAYEFAAYLIDELSLAFHEEHWQRYRPREQRYIFYKGPLFRADSRPPEIVFREGFTVREHHSVIADYAKYVTGSVGVSCSKNLEAAAEYAATQAGSQHYVYIIDYDDDFGLDCALTAIEQCRKAKWGKKWEVNCLQDISTEKILGCFIYDDRGFLIDRKTNPHYTGVHLSFDEIHRWQIHYNAPTRPELRKETSINIRRTAFGISTATNQPTADDREDDEGPLGPGL